LSDVGRVAVTNIFKLLSILHLYLLFYCNFLIISVVILSMLTALILPLVY